MARSGNRDRCIAGDEEMVRACWDTMMDMMTDEGCHVSVELYPTAQRGVFHCTITAVSRVDPDVGRMLGQISGQFPNGVAGTLSAFLFGKTNSLSQMVTNVRASDLEQTFGRRHKKT